MIPAFLISRFGPAGAKAVFFGGIVALLVVIASVIYFTGRSDGKQGETISQQKREIEVQEQVGDANTNASAARVEDAVKSEQQKEQLDAAIEATDDPDRQRTLRGCVILRQQGRDTSRIPACS